MSIESKLPCFCPISVGNHTRSNHAQTYTRIEKTTPQKVAKNFYTPLREKGNQNHDFYRFSGTKESLKKLMSSYDKGFKGRLL